MGFKFDLGWEAASYGFISPIQGAIAQEVIDLLSIPELIANDSSDEFSERFPADPVIPTKYRYCCRSDGWRT
jgi:hypothetical protein